MGFVNGLIPGLSFGAPMVLLALAGLPIIFWLLRVTPPAPKRVVFPPLRLLFGLISPEETPSRTPLWLLLLRLATAAVAIIALSEPVYDSAPSQNADAPLLLVIDNDWAAAQNWQQRVGTMQTLLTAAETAEQPVTIVSTAETNPLSPQWMAADEAAGTADEISPEPWLANRAEALAALENLGDAPSAPRVVWLSNGLDDEGARAFADALAGFGDLTIYADDAATAPLGLCPPENAANGFQVTVIRASGNGTRAGQVAALDGRGLVLEAAPFQFTPGATEATALIELPLELRNDTVRIIVQGAESAGSVQLLDSRYLRRPVGVVGNGNASIEQPLISDLFYIERALQISAEVRKGTLAQVIDSGIVVLVLADIGQLSDAERARVTEFVEGGGMLLRFSGPRVAALPPEDSLMPVRLRGGERLMGSALAWAEPQKLAPFPEGTPFHGLPVPDDVAVSRQVLAEPSIELADQTWARLTDGTPLVTSVQRGAGQIVLFHVPASPGWSSLPLSGLFVEMLRRTVNMSGGVRGQVTDMADTVPPYQTLDAFGNLVRPYPEALAISTSDLDTLAPSAQHPPGLYGNQSGTIAFNAVNAETALASLDAGRVPFSYATGGVLTVYKWPLLQLVLLVLLADAVISLFLRGYIPSPRGSNRESGMAGRTAGFVLAFALAMQPGDVRAAAGLPDPREAMNMSSALDTKLAYVITGTPDVDEMSRAGLFGLSLQVHARTAYEPVTPVGLDLERDDLSFYPLIYWPMTPARGDLSPEALSKVDAFMRNGGTILFDTRDQPLTGLAAGVASPGEQTLRRLLEKLDIPPLQPVPPEHVLTKSFYLLEEFPGRWIGGQVWIEALPEPQPGEDLPVRGGDGVSPIIIGGNDWAAAWALDEEAMPIAAVVPGGEEQREMAVRFGVNVVMYALTGNYKTDQVHVQTLLDRMGEEP
jgi:hypothetical protein